MNKYLKLVTAFLFLYGLSGYAHAITVTFNFTGECDDCAFAGDPNNLDFNPFNGFDPLNDGLTETVSGSLTLVGLSENNGMIENLGAGSVIFTYNGSSLINSFTMADPYSFSDGLLTSGDVADGFEFQLSSTQNFTDPSNPLSFQFPDFCTALGEQVLGGDCFGVGDVTFKLASNGDWSITGIGASDIGGNGSFTVSAVPVPGAVVLFASGLLGFIGVARRRTTLNS